VLAAAARGLAAIIVAEPVPARRELALSLGATHAIDPADGDLAPPTSAPR
jgi:aryl-alcohol dehydrogenase